MTKVLVFESDSTFASELSASLATYGCQTSVVDDATAGLSAAVTAKPDLILLSIELPRMNGFSVCNKLKRDPALKDVPLIIMSSDSSEETFEQHRRLRTRAEDYVHKPIAFEQLLTRIRAFVPLQQGASAAAEMAEEDDVVLIDSESFRPAAEEGESIETEVESFADSAFDAIMDRPSGKPATMPPPSNGAAVSGSFAPPKAATTSFADDERYRERLAELQEELRSARSRIVELESTSGTSADAGEIERLRRELQETKSKAGGKGSSARDFLDLREALNKKDKELLDLRDQLTHRDKELLALRDSALMLEREKADLADRHDEFERQLGESKKLVDAAKADKEQAAKRAEDFKRKLEKLQTEHDARAGELSALRQLFDNETALRGQRIEELERLLEDSRRTSEERLERALAEAREQADRTHTETLLARETELKQEHAERLGDLAKSRDEALAALETQHASRLVELNQAHEASRQELVSAQERDLAEQRSQREQLERTLGQRLADLERELEVRTRERDEEREGRGQRDAELANRRHELENLQRELEGVRSELSAERQQLERARGKWTEDRASLERAKDALAAALSQIEEAESRPID